jgi:hypothetical protein
MAKTKKATEHLRNKKEINVELIPVYIPDNEFQENKKIVQQLIARMLVTSQKRGRPSHTQDEDFDYAA